MSQQLLDETHVAEHGPPRPRLEQATGSDDIGDGAVYRIIDHLMETYNEGIRVLQRAVNAKATSSELRVLAERTIDRAALAGDAESIERALAVADAASRAEEEENRCAVEWAVHQANATETLADAADLLQGLSKRSR
jgi:hypothetical protein